MPGLRTHPVTPFLHGHQGEWLTLTRMHWGHIEEDPLEHVIQHHRYNNTIRRACNHDHHPEHDLGALDKPRPLCQKCQRMNQQRAWGLTAPDWTQWQDKQRRLPVGKEAV